MTTHFALVWNLRYRYSKYLHGCHIARTLYFLGGFEHIQIGICILFDYSPTLQWQRHLNHPSRKTSIRLSCKDNAIGADALATLGVKSSTVMIGPVCWRLWALQSSCAGRRWSLFCSRYFQIHFCMIVVLINDKLALVDITVWRRPGADETWSGSVIA